MKLISLTLHNFRKFRDLELKFPDGVVGLVGSNGAGKSTIIEAIGWAIYGNKAARTPKDQIKRQHAAKSADCWVKFSFKLEKNAYEVFRINTERSSDARVKINGVITASSTHATTEFLEKKLGMDYDAFYTSIIAKQQELNALSNKSPSERKRSMLRMLKIDVLEDAIKNVREDRRVKEKTVEHLERNLKKIDEIESKKELNENKLKGYEKTKKDLKMGIFSIKTQFS